MKNRTNQLKRRMNLPGFTLLEMMLVVLIIGLLMAVAVINFAGQGETARIKTSQATMSQLKTAINLYFTNNGFYPPTLQAMRETNPPLIEKIGRDGWREEFMYSAQSSNPQYPFTLYSKGKDRKAGSEDDLSIWNIEE
ncbi:MAG: type II secretion system protein GspG [Pyrinomonadaceae bacterium]|nr:type II secretion system protein GspG [Phycisphaerales bacterium]